MALLSRISFFLAIPFVLLNNTQSVEITKLKGDWPLPKRIVSNFGLATILCTAMLLLSETYLGLFSSSKISETQNKIIVAMLIAHAANISSAGLVPYLACTKKAYLNTAVAVSLLYFVFLYAFINKTFDEPPELKFSLALYSTLFILKISIITLSLLAHRKFNHDIHR
ncbi:hypothetical protein FQZ97_976270 [compost metagenome]